MSGGNALDRGGDRVRLPGHHAGGGSGGPARLSHLNDAPTERGRRAALVQCRRWLAGKGAEVDGAVYFYPHGRDALARWLGELT